MWKGSSNRFSSTQEENRQNTRSEGKLHEIGARLATFKDEFLFQLSL